MINEIESSTAPPRTQPELQTFAPWRGLLNEQTPAPADDETA